MLHRDLKSANVRLSGSGQVKVVDFGLAMSFKEGELEGPTKSTLMDSSAVSGTLAYLAPEVLAGEKPDVRSDIWSLGVMLYEMASGTHPFRGRTAFEMSSTILREAPRALPTHVPPGLRAIILHCLAKQPEQRYQRAGEVKAALEALHSNGGAVAAAAGPAGVASETRERAGRSKRNWWIGGGLAAAIAVLLFVFVGPWKQAKVAAPVAGGKLRLLLSTERDISGPAISPEGKKLAYVERGEIADDLYLKREAG